jgi:quercetin dioxygenase-like cupin family protein
MAKVKNEAKTEKQESQLTPAQPVVLSEMVNYEAGSVVSRTLAKNKAGNVTLFSFDKEQGLSEHSAPFDALVQILEGRAELTIDGKTVEAKAGQMVLMPANVPHALHAPEPFKMLLIMIKGLRTAKLFVDKN